MNEIFKKRRSIRQFTGKEVSEEQVHDILCAAMVSPSGNHVNPWEFVVVRDKEKLSKLGDCGQWQGFVKDCNVAIVIIRDIMLYFFVKSQPAKMIMSRIVLPRKYVHILASLSALASSFCFSC